MTDPVVQRSYAECAEGYGFRIDPCTPPDPHKKGIVEAGGKYVKNNSLPLRTFRDMGLYPDYSYRLLPRATVQPGSSSILSMEDMSLSQFARLDQQICALGRIAIELSSDPAGTARKPTSGWETGSADPQTVQKLFTWREPGSRNVLMLASPDTQMSLAVDENKFAEWAEPLPFRQREQWHRKKLSNSPDIWKLTAPQRHFPVVVLSSIHTPLDRPAPYR